MSFRTILDNRTPFSAGIFVLPDVDGQELSLLVVRAAFVAKDGQGLHLSESPEPIRLNDEHRGAPDDSSTVYESDLALRKPWVDLLVNGHAYAVGVRNVEQVVVRIRLADIDKALLVSGDQARSGNRQPFSRMPVVYERAFGGRDAAGKADWRNPVGLGFGGALSRDPTVASVSPNITFVNRSLSGPAGLGVIGRSWKPRVDFAGTYDQEWLDTRWPLLPRDFDARYYQAAPQDQQTRTIRGGEPVRIDNMTPTGEWAFRMPVLDVPVHLLYDDRYQQTSLSVDTVLIEPDTYRLSLTCRLGIRTDRSRKPLRMVILGHVTRAWLRAVARRKVYIDRRGSSGSDPMRLPFLL